MTTTDPSIFSAVPPNFLIDRVFPLQNATDEANRQSFVESGQQSPAEAAARRAIEAPGSGIAESGPAVAGEDDSRLANLERTTMLSTLALSELGRKIARLEETVKRVTR